MKRLSVMIFLAMLLTGCGKAEESASDVTVPTELSIPNNPDADPNSDVDLTTLSSTMVYSQVADMMYAPEKYNGLIVKAKGLFSVYHDEFQDKDYYAVLIEDATACCAQGLEFVWKGEHAYPEDYPEIGEEITIMGTFRTYEEDGATYCQLVEADLTINS